MKNLPANAGDTGDGVSIPGWGSSPREGNEPTPVFLPRESHRGAWWAQSMGLERVGHDRAAPETINRRPRHSENFRWNDLMKM